MTMLCRCRRLAIRGQEIGNERAKYPHRLRIRGIDTYYDAPRCENLNEFSKTLDDANATNIAQVGAAKGEVT